MTYVMPRRKPVNTEYSSLLLILLFIFLKVRNGECWRHDRVGPSPSSQKNQAKFPALDSSTLVGLEQQTSIASSYRAGGTPAPLLFIPLPEKQGEGGPQASRPAGLSKGLPCHPG